MKESQQTIKWFHQPASEKKKKKKNYVHISEMWEQLELKVSANSNALKVRKVCTKFWNERGYSAIETEDDGSHYPPHKSES